MIDWTQVKNLRNDVGSDAFEEIIEIFLDEVNSVITKLRDEPRTSDLENDMHFLKGSALNLGFDALSKMCQQGENLSAAGKIDEVDLPSIVSCFDSSKSTFLSDVSSVLRN